MGTEQAVPAAFPGAGPTPEPPPPPTRNLLLLHDLDEPVTHGQWSASPSAKDAGAEKLVCALQWH